MYRLIGNGSARLNLTKKNMRKMFVKTNYSNYFNHKYPICASVHLTGSFSSDHTIYRRYKGNLLLKFVRKKWQLITLFPPPPPEPFLTSTAP